MRDEVGQFAFITALLGLPLVMICGYAVDMNKIVGKKTSISSALDAAALASVIPANLNQAERISFARQVFDENYFGDIPVSLRIEASRELVKITGTSTVPSLFGGILGMDGVGVTDTATAVLTIADVVCVLALDPTGERAIEFKDQATFNSPACSVQVNSTNELAMVSDVVIPPVAKSFCVGGVSRGEFAPYVKHACSPIADPYKDLVMPKAGKACDSSKQIKIKGTNTAVAESGMGTSVTGEVLIPSNIELSPGIYCKGIKITGANVTLLPGVYHVWGNFEVGKYAEVDGEGVTIILKGTKNKLDIKSGAQVTLTAPMDGLTAGLVFWQKHLDFKSYVRGRATKPPKGVTAKSKIASGGGLNIVGTAYFPNHELLISRQRTGNFSITRHIFHCISFEIYREK